MLPSYSIQAHLCLVAIVSFALAGNRQSLEARYILISESALDLGNQHGRCDDQSRPFQCPSEPNGEIECIPLEYLCDGVPDCPSQADSGSPASSFDEDAVVCQALGRRHPTELDQSLLRILLTDQQEPNSGLQKRRRLIKRSGISDQILAEIQMNRALRKQIERAKLATITGSKSESSSR